MTKFIGETYGANSAYGSVNIYSLNQELQMEVVYTFAENTSDIYIISCLMKQIIASGYLLVTMKNGQEYT